MASSKFEEPAYWHPKCKNFVIMDWKKWESLNYSIPENYNPPQKNFLNSWKNIPMWWNHRSWLFCPIPYCVLSSCCSPKETMAYLTDGNKVINDMLGPHPDSSKVPEAVRNSLFWMEDNIAAETLFSFNRAAWRSQTPEGRVIGVGNLGYDFTNDVNVYGAILSFLLKSRYYNFQQSPDGKWILVAVFNDPNNVEEEIQYIWVYVVQEGDVFKSEDGNVIDFVKPGDIIRITFQNQSDPYDISSMKYWYFPRRVATLDEATGQVNTVSPHYDDMMKKVNTDQDQCCETCGFCCSCGWSAEDRFNYAISYPSNVQVYNCAPTPPSGDVIERL